MHHKLLAGLVVAVVAANGVLAAQNATPKPGPQPLTLAEAKRTVRLMNDIYISGVLTTHKMYASEPGTAAAVSWGKQVIREINGKGWPKARIFGAGDRMLNPENQPVDAFERDAAARFTKGQTEFESTVPGKYRFAIPLRITDDGCLNCHVRNKKGDLIGGVSYEAILAK